MRGLDGGRELMEAISSEAMAFIDYDGMPVVRPHSRDQVARCEAIDGCEQVILVLRLGATCQQFAKRVIAKGLTIRTECLPKDLRTMGDEE